jgi:RNA polymerase sigma-70 factor (ECF subfamily)
MLANAHDVPCRDQKEISDATLVERAVDGCSLAFETLVCRYRTKFLRLAQGIVDGESDAQDVLQKALIKIHDKLDTLRDPSSFGSWAYRVVKNTALMRIRKQKRNAEIGFGDLGPGHDDERHYEALTPEYRSQADEAFEVSELREHLSEAVEELEPKYQSVFVMYEFEGMELEEIGGVLDLTAAGVKSRLHRARLYLRATLERYVRGS